MYLIVLVTDRYSYKGGITEKIVGYKEKEDEAKRYCDESTENLKGTYNESMGHKYYRYEELKML